MTNSRDSIGDRLDETLDRIEKFEKVLATASPFVEPELEMRLNEVSLWLIKIVHLQHDAIVLLDHEINTIRNRLEETHKR